MLHLVLPKSIDTEGILSPTALEMVDERKVRDATGMAERKAPTAVSSIARARHLIYLRLDRLMIEPRQTVSRFNFVNPPEKKLDFGILQKRTQRRRRICDLSL